MIKNHPKEIVLSALVRMSEQMPFYVFTAFVLAYLTDETHGYSNDFVAHRDLGRGRDRVRAAALLRAPVRHGRAASGST